MNAEQAEREAERRFRDYRAEASCTCGVYRLGPESPRAAARRRTRLALRPDRPAPVQ